MRAIIVIVCTLFVFGVSSLKAQEAVGRPSAQDSIIVVGDSVVVETDSVVVTADSTAIAKKVNDILFSDSFFAPSYMFKPSAKKAVIFSAIFPGLGQAYNRKYWKLPLVYGGFVGFAYAINWNNGYYRDYLKAYQDILDGNPDTNDWHNMLPYGMDPNSVDKKWFTDVLKQRKDYYRYYRDFSIIGTAAWYVLVMIDAYVDAQLFDFNMSTDLSMRVGPAVIGNKEQSLLGGSYGLRCSINF
ncbi:MAG: DUF5683 domain-containing protein [Fermentimonas sp.]|jgi:hypothetical protein